jgi:hypothetical protein
MRILRRNHSPQGYQMQILHDWSVERHDNRKTGVWLRSKAIVQRVSFSRVLCHALVCATDFELEAELKKEVERILNLGKMPLGPLPPQSSPTDDSSSLGGGGSNGGGFTPLAPRAGVETGETGAPHSRRQSLEPGTDTKV